MKPTTACALNNIVAIVTFAVLAYLFEKWWIVFFAILFLASAKDKEEEEE